VTKILTKNFKMDVAQNFHDSFADDVDSSSCVYYMVGAESVAFANTIPAATDSVYSESYEIHDKMLFGKRIYEADVSYMIKNIPWVSGSQYDIYDDTDDDLVDKNFYVIADQADGSYSVFKCIGKNYTLNSTPVTITKPNKNRTAADEFVYITGDGYEWKFLFTISAIDYTKFATTNWVPVTEDVAVTSNAVSGSIDSIVIESSGAVYNNYSSGSIKEPTVGGSTTTFSLEGDAFDRIITYDINYTSNGVSNNVFVEGDTVDIAVPGSNTVSVEVYKVGTSTVSFEINDDTQGITQSTLVSANASITVTGNTVVADVLQIRQENVSQLSGLDDFYNGSVMYIRSGPGAGETRTIQDYAVTGNQKIVEIDSAWTTTPTTASRFSILPKITITGDGSNAIAIPVIDTTANSIVDIQILDRGTNYTFATATAVGNTGVIDANGAVINSTEASLRPIISPKGGHGADVKTELFAHNVGISITFANNDVDDSLVYNEIGIVKDLLFDGVELTLDTLANNDFAVGEYVNQENIKASGYVDSIDTANNILTLTNVLGEFAVSGNSVIGATSNTYSTISSINKSIDVFDSTITVETTTLSGTFVVEELITQASSGSSARILSISANNSIVLSEILGDFDTGLSNQIVGASSGSTGYISSKTTKGIVDNSGETIYLENIQEIQRSGTTEERIKIVINI
jgi:hypothetical protein